MNDDFGKWECGKPWLDMEEPAPRRPRPGGECLADTGCNPAWKASYPPPEPCPRTVRVVTMEELVRDEPGAPNTDEYVVVRGRLVSFHSRLITSFSTRDTCGFARPIFALESRVGDTCYGVGLDTPTFGCVIDHTMFCCGHLPVGEEVAVVGTYSRTPAGVPTFASWLGFARICTLPAPP